jgi:hypothetical protein
MAREGAAASQVGEEDGSPSEKEEMTKRKHKEEYCVYDGSIVERLKEIARGGTDAIKKAQKLYPNVDFHGVLLSVVHQAATVATNAAEGKPLGRRTLRGPRGKYGQGQGTRNFDNVVHIALWGCRTIPALMKELEIPQSKVKVLRRSLDRLVAEGRAKLVRGDRGSEAAVYEPID